ncbi:MAG: type I-G CRISPR-associated helicase/endonuclease Cas3g, partial [Gemmataceae bacterium]
LPMRVLVEQTYAEAIRWLDRLGILAGAAEWKEQSEKRGLSRYQAKLGLHGKISVHVLMGGEETEDWDLYPERGAILVGTQDMLLSRALNRGYGMSRYRWPMHFGLFHADCLWVFDEVQLMGSGLATTAQLEAFRSVASESSSSWWMSATLDRRWLGTVDYRDQAAKLPLSQLEDDDLTIRPGDDEPTKRAKKNLRRIHEARKPQRPADARIGNASCLAGEVVDAHRKAGGRTLVVVNTVRRARELHAAVRRELKAAGPSAQPVLIHSRFRPPERAEQVKRLLEEPGEHGTIVISTQVVEAGVDASARTLFTELAPWPSLVQRFGRCNRRGTENDTAQVFWMDLPRDEKEQEKVRHPYDLQDLIRSRKLLRDCKEVSPASLGAMCIVQRFPHTQVIRRRDFIELFDTTPDLAGNDVDIDRYVREVGESDVKVFWRDWPTERPSKDMDAPRRDELCPVPIGEFRDFVRDGHRRDLAYLWDYLSRDWASVNADRVRPGQTYLVHADDGGYARDIGWNAKLDQRVPVTEAPGPGLAPEANDDDTLSEREWQSVGGHTDRVCCELEVILAELALPESQKLNLAARWHDWGKAHEFFQRAIRANGAQGETRPAIWVGRTDVAKAPRGWWKKYERRHFRHELASALAVLQRAHNDFVSLSEDDLNLIAYLIAAHHGKVRLSIRSLPGEKMPPGTERFARGVWDADELPPTDLGGGVTAPAVTLSLEPMELGLCEEAPFAGQPSWAERMLVLRDRVGPCRLAYLEAILRAADIRASKDVQSKEKP